MLPPCLRRLLLCAWLAGAAAAHAAVDEAGSNRQPVKAVADQRLTVTTAAGSGSLALFASRPFAGNSVEADIERAVIVVHGQMRNALSYWRATQAAAQASAEASRRTLLVAPHFLAERDTVAHGLKPEALRWSLQGWAGGDAAVGPAPISSFEAIDALLAQLADRRRFPRLRQVVIAGHSAGGQLVQRHAVVGQGEAQLAARGVPLRYVVANPSSYLYFNADRPMPGGRYAPADAAACPGVDQWKYGWTGAPPYARQLSPAEYEKRYVARDVVYLLGSADTDPQHPALDKSCAGKAQGPFRLARGHNYMGYLRSRHPELTQVVRDVPGVGHEGGRMLTSACGRAALFDDPTAAAGCLDLPAMDSRRPR